MGSEFKLSQRGKREMVLHYLRGNLGFFIRALIYACLAIMFNALAPKSSDSPWTERWMGKGGITC